MNTKLLLGFNAIGVLRQQSSPAQTDPCFPSPCGPGADCRSTGNRAVSSLQFQLSSTTPNIQSYTEILTLHYDTKFKYIHILISS